MKLREKDIQLQILDWLTLHKVFHYRNNVGAMSGEHKGKRWVVRFGTRGAPDIVCVIRGRFIGIEVKTPGKDASKDQEAFAASLVDAGGAWILAHCLAEVILPIEEILRHPKSETGTTTQD